MDKAIQRMGDTFKGGINMIMEWIRRVLKPILDDEYIKGYEAGVMAQMLKEKDDQNRRLHELYRYGVIRGQEEARSEIGEIVIDDLADLFEEGEAV